MEEGHQVENRVKNVKAVIEPESVIEGAGVRLQRSLGGKALDYADPFLLFDHFKSNKVEDYQAGFPLHPHRGIETVTYMVKGEVQHRDTLGHEGIIGPGDVQWMTAGRGILHEEMPRIHPQGVEGFQLWVNLPATHKMMPPRYQEISSRDIPVVSLENGVSMRVIAGTVEGEKGPVSTILADPTYLDVRVPAGQIFSRRIPHGHAVLVYVVEGSVEIEGEEQNSSRRIPSPSLVVFHNDGDFIRLSAPDQPARLLVMSAKPLGEPVARYGPFVMNTREEIDQALLDLKRGTFIWSEKRHP